MTSSYPYHIIIIGKEKEKKTDQNLRIFGLEICFYRLFLSFLFFFFADAKKKKFLFQNISVYVPTYCMKSLRAG